LIRIENLCKRYGDSKVLENVSAKIEKGEVISIIGPSGCGKSTFIRCLNLLEQPTGGRILIDGDDITDKKADVQKLRMKMGMVFQSFNLFSHLSIIENVMLAPVHLLKMEKQQAYAQGMELLETVGLAHKAGSYPDELSGGQKQRVAIARTLAMHPEIVLFDEPTSALDPTMVSEVLTVIKKLAAKNMTMMIVTHEMKFARDVSTRILFMNEGGIYEDGTPEQIFEHPQKEKTRIFIKRLKVFHLEFESNAFDYIGALGEIEQFGSKNLLPPRAVQKAMLIFEEAVAETILGRGRQQRKLWVDFEYSETESSIRITICYDGDRFDPFKEGDELSVLLMKKSSSSTDFRYENGKNCVTVTIPAL